MEIQIEFAGLERAVRRMGATPRYVDLGNSALDKLSPISIELEHGIEIELKSVEVNAGSLLGYQGHQVVLYIPDHGESVEKALEDGETGRKVHVADCSTLKIMRDKGRYERYFVRNGLSPMFVVTGVNRDREEVKGETKLHVCKNCMKLLNYKDFKNKKKLARSAIVGEFSLDQFFASYSSYFKYMPSRKSSDLESNRYSSNWNEISKAYKEGLSWRCEHCSVDLSSGVHQRLLHVHHINGVKGDNSESNLKALCIDCHSKEEMHEHLDVKHSDRRIIQTLRREQGVYSPAPKDSTATRYWKEARMNADPAVHGLLFELEAQGYSVPEVGPDVIDPKTHRIIYSNAKLLWLEQKVVVVLEKDSDCKALEGKEWTVYTAQELLDSLNNE